MTDVRAGGRRRIDRVLAPDYLDGLADLPVHDVRARRAEAEGEETTLSSLARQLTDRLEVVAAEQQRRAADRRGELNGLPGGTAEAGRPGPATSEAGQAAPAAADAGSGQLVDAPRWARARWSRPADDPGRSARRRRVERLVANVDLSDVATRTDDELKRVSRTFRAEEQRVNEVRARVRQVVDQCGVELAARYRAGQATAADLLDLDLDADPAAGPRTER